MRMLIPFKSTAKAEDYFRHRQTLRFMHLLGTGIAQKLDNRLKEGFDNVSEQARHIHHAVVDQTQVIQKGLFGIELSLEQGFDQIDEGLGALQQQLQKIDATLIQSSSQIVEGLGGLKASVDMGMLNILSQFELQRGEIQAGFDRLVDLLENSRKSQARERYLDGKQEYERYLQHPDEEQFLIDAHDYLNESIDIYRGNPFCHLYLGHIHHEAAAKFDLPKSLQHYQWCATYAKGLENRPLAGLAYFMGAWISYVLGDHEAAIEQAQKSIDYDPEGIPENYYNLARFYAARKQAKPALQFLNTAIRQFDPMYSLKASVDPEFKKIETELNAYFDELKQEAAQNWMDRLNQYPSIPDTDSESKA